MKPTITEEWVFLVAVVLIYRLWHGDSGRRLAEQLIVVPPLALVVVRVLGWVVGW